MKHIFDQSSPSCRLCGGEPGKDVATECPASADMVTNFVIDGMRAAMGQVIGVSNQDLESRLTAAVRVADVAFEQSGGSSRHYVRECLLPSLAEAGLMVVDAGAKP